MAKQKMRKKKTVLAVSLVGLLVLVGGTIAYHTSTGSFINLFHLGLWRNETVEEFTSPENWSTCDEVEKTVIARNTGSVPAAVRIKYEDYWKMKGSTSTDHTSELPKVDESDGQAYANINFQNQNLWTDGGDGWYYYKYILEPGTETKSFFKSVTLNCNKNFAGENSVCEVVDNKKTCTRPENQYDEATYHIFITTQYIQEDGCSEWGHCAEKRHAVKCDGLELYDRVACLADGTDENENFSNSNPSVTGNGVKAVASHADDSWPIYYYRGQSNVRNHVLFANYCWRIIRTTETGGVKLLYNGLPQNGQCLDLTQYISGVSDLYTYSLLNMNNQTSFHYNENVNNSSDSVLHMTGYMYDNLQRISNSNNGTEHYVANDVTWDGEQYHLVTPQKVTYDNNTYRYYCPDPNATTCTSVAFMADYSNSNHNRYVLSDGKKYDDIIHGGDTDTIAKRNIDQWYADNLTSFADKLEDTVYCSDRSYSKDYNKYWSGDYSMSSIYFDAYHRLYYSPIKPVVDCPDARDAFTVSSENGNGRLTYPIAMPTIDEIYMAGKPGYMYLYYYNNRLFTMTPYNYYYFYTYSSYTDYDSIYSYNGSLRPVVSLKPGTAYKEGGQGTAAKPYVIE